MSERPRRPGPTVRTRVEELFADGTQRRHEDRLATEEPLEIRLAWPGAAARRVWLTMRTPGHDFELAAGWLVHEGLARPGDVAAVAYCTDVDLAPEQEFNVVTVTLAAPPAERPRAPPRRAVLGLVGVRGVRQGQHRGRAGGGHRGPVGRPAAHARRGPTAPGGDGRAAERLRPHRGRPRGRAVRRRRHPAHRARGRGPPQRRGQGHRRPGAGRGLPRGRLPRRQRPGRLRAGAEGRQQRGSARWSASAPRPASRPGWPGRAAWCCTASPRPGGACATPERHPSRRADADPRGVRRRGCDGLSVAPPTV